VSDVFPEIYKIVQSIPKGRVLTYGLISHMVGGRMSAQGVGWALMALGKTKQKTKTSLQESTKKSRAGKNGDKEQPDFSLESVPWQRVVNTQGGTSTHKTGLLPPGFQQHLLEAEGVVFNNEGKIDLPKYLWVEGAQSSDRKSKS
jgi:methylated-DNA-protein-cysteine methyltransferase-like protein